MISDNLTDYAAKFDSEGYVLMEATVTADQLAALNEQLQCWISESRQHNGDFGKIMDGRPRFDVEPKTHVPKTPALRRISSPIEVSDSYLAVT